MTRGCTILLLIPLIPLIAGADKPSDAAKKDLERLQGDWKVVTAQRRGKDVPAEVAAMMAVTVKDNAITIGDGGVRDEKATLSNLDPSKSPASFALQPVRPGSESLPGIYKLDGDNLTLCWSKKGERPTEFVTKEGSDHLLLVLKRASK